VFVEWVKKEIVLSSDTLLNLHLAMLEESILSSYQQKKLKSHKRKEN